MARGRRWLVEPLAPVALAQRVCRRVPVPLHRLAGSAPAWAQRMRRHQAMSHGISAAAHAVRSGDHGGGSTSVSLSEGHK